MGCLCSLHHITSWDIQLIIGRTMFISIQPLQAQFWKECANISCLLLNLAAGKEALIITPLMQYICQLRAANIASRIPSKEQVDALSKELRERASIPDTRRYEKGISST